MAHCIISPYNKETNEQIKVITGGRSLHQNYTYYPVANLNNKWYYFNQKNYMHIISIVEVNLIHYNDDGKEFSHYAIKDYTVSKKGILSNEQIYHDYKTKEQALDYIKSHME